MSGKPKPVSRRLRFEILRRDGNTCRYCGAHAPDVPLTVDHVVPVALGGSNDPSNLVTACRDCNSGKSSSAPDAELVAEVDATALLFARAMDQAKAMLRERTAETERLFQSFDETWLSWGWTDREGNRRPVERPDDWRVSVERMVAAGLDVDDLVELVQVAMRADASDTWRYFCGCCWTRLRERQDLARQLIEEGRFEPDPPPVETWVDPLDLIEPDLHELGLDEPIDWNPVPGHRPPAHDPDCPECGSPEGWKLDDDGQATRCTRTRLRAVQ